MNDPERAAIKARIAEEQARAAERGEGPGPVARLVEFGRRRPVLSVAGGLLIGVAVAALFSGPRRAVRRGGRKASRAVGMGRDLAAAYAARALAQGRAAGREGARSADRLGDTLSGTFESWRSDLERRTDQAVRGARRGGSGLSDLLVRLANRR